jgi:hypothetical protein
MIPVTQNDCPVRQFVVCLIDVQFYLNGLLKRRNGFIRAGFLFQNNGHVKIGFNEIRF